MLFMACMFFSIPALKLEMICLSCCFGLNQALSDGIPLTMAGTQEYAAPEVLDGGSPSEKQDVCLSLSRCWFDIFSIFYPKHVGFHDPS